MSLPRSCILEITYNCNQHCPFCSNSWKCYDDYPVSQQLNGKQWIEVIKNLSKMGVQDYCLSGGEPTLHPDFLEIIDFLHNRTEEVIYYMSKDGNKTKKRKIPFSLITNGDTDIFTKDLCSRLAESNATISVSLNGDSKIYEKILRGRYEKTIQTIKKLLFADVKTILNLTIFKGIEDKVIDIIQTAINLGVKNILLMRATSFGNVQKEMITPNLTEWKKILSDCNKIGKENTISIGIGCLMPECKISNKEFAELKIFHKCYCGKKMFCVDPSGYVKPCTCSNIIGGTIDNTIGAIQSKVFTSFNNREHQDFCANCKDIEDCSGGCPAEWYSI